MVVNKWAELSKLADMAFEMKSRKMSGLRSQEDVIVLQRQALSNMNTAAMDGFAGVHLAHQMSGDFHWQEWVGGNMQRLGVQQAQVRARIEMLKPELRKAYGRKNALVELSELKTR